MDSQALDPCCIQSHSPLTICLIAVGANQSAWRNPTLKSQSGTIPHIPVMVYWWNPHTYIAMIYWWNSSARGRHWELSVLPKDTKYMAVTGLEPTLAQANRLMGEHSTNELTLLPYVKITSSKEMSPLGTTINFGYHFPH